MSLRNKLKGLIFEVKEDEAPVAKPATGKPAASATASPSTASRPRVATTTQPAQELVDEDIYQLIAEEVSRKGGTAYKKFVEQLTALRSIISDEASLYKAAVAAASTAVAGTNYQSIVGAISERLSALDAEVEEVNTELNDEESTQVAAKQAELETARAQVERLRQDLQEKEQLADTLTSDIGVVKNRVATRRAQFAAAATKMRNELQDARAKLERYK